MNNYECLYLFQTFNKFVQIGRVAYVAYGPAKGNLVVIVDVIDSNKVSASCRLM